MVSEEQKWASKALKIYFKSWSTKDTVQLQQRYSADSSEQQNDLEQSLLEDKISFLNSRAHLGSIFKLFSHQPAHLMS